MTLLGVQQRFREIGRIRTGEVRFTKGGKPYPASLETFRFTSLDRDAIEAVAKVYGGTVSEWDRGGWQVTTTSDRINIMLPPRGAAEPYSLNYELWSGGGLQRRCDGRDAVVNGEESVCICDPDARECAPTLRVSLLLPDLPGLGTWRHESKGYNAAAELPGSLNLLSLYSDRGQPVRAVLRLEKRTVKRDGETHKFVVPTIDMAVSINELMSRPALPALPMIEPLGAGVREEPDSDDAVAPPDEAGAGDSPPPAPALTPDLLANRYRWAERYDFDHAGLDAAAVEAMGAPVSELDDAAWRAFAITVKARAIAPVASPQPPGGTEAPEPDSNGLPPMDPALAARVERAAARGRGEKA